LCLGQCVVSESVRRSHYGTKTLIYEQAPCGYGARFGGTMSIRPKLPAADVPSSYPSSLLKPSQGSVRPTGTLRRVGASLLRTGIPRHQKVFFSWGWKRTLQKAGLPESITFHQLRHGTASLLLNQNVPVPVVSRYLGHANPGITMKVYAHLIDGTSGMAATGMYSALG
jgi:hypothetical protein